MAIPHPELTPRWDCLGWHLTPQSNHITKLADCIMSYGPVQLYATWWTVLEHCGTLYHDQVADYSMSQYVIVVHYIMTR